MKQILPQTLPLQFALALLAVLGWGCASTPIAQEPDDTTSQKWFLDPSVEMGHYRTYGLLQAMAVRYQEPIPPKPKYRQGLFSPFVKREDKRPVMNHTDELIWRTLALEMDKKGYRQVAPEAADIILAYYGGPRTQTAPEGIRVEKHAFDAYFAQNELQPHSFFVDVIDAKKATLIYRGWDNATYSKEKDRKSLEPQRVIESTALTLEFFPSAR